MGSALETLCGQAVGAGQFHILGIYLQRSWVITLATATVLTPLYVFTAPILKLLRQPTDISEVAGEFCVWVIPQLFAYAVNFPLQKFFQSQRKVWVITEIAGAVLGLHILLNWVFVVRLGYGLAAAAIIGNVSWWLINLAQMVYLFSGCFRDTWTGFSLLAFQNLSAFFKLSLASAVMLWLVLCCNSFRFLRMCWLICCAIAAWSSGTTLQWSSSWATWRIQTWQLLPFPSG